MKKCKKCNTELEMYYKEYCPKCDIQKMIYDTDNPNALVYFPIMYYGKKYFKEFNEKLLWNDICEVLKSNDSYCVLTLNYSKNHLIFRKILDELNIKYTNSILLWVSW